MPDRSCYISLGNRDAEIAELKRQIAVLHETVNSQAEKIESQALEIAEYSRMVCDLRQEVRTAIRANAPLGL